MPSSQIARPVARARAHTHTHTPTCTLHTHTHIHPLIPLESWGRNSENFQPGQRALGAGRKSNQPVPLRLPGAAAARSRHPRRRGATHRSVPCPRSVPDPIPAESPHPPSAFQLPKALFAFSLFLFLALRARSEGEEEEEFFPRLTFQGTQFTPSLFPFQAASEVLPVTATSDPKLRGEPPNLKPSFPSPSLSASSRYLHRHLHLRHPPTAAAATSSASFSPPPPLFSLVGSRWTSGVDGGSGGSLSSSSPRRTPALAHPASFSSPTSQSPERCWADSGRQRRSGCSGGRSGGGSGSGGGRQDERTR